VPRLCHLLFGEPLTDTTAGFTFYPFRCNVTYTFAAIYVDFTFAALHTSLVLYLDVPVYAVWRKTAFTYTLHTVVWLVTPFNTPCVGFRPTFALRCRYCIQFPLFRVETLVTCVTLNIYTRTLLPYALAFHARAYTRGHILTGFITRGLDLADCTPLAPFPDLTLPHAPLRFTFTCCPSSPTVPLRLLALVFAPRLHDVTRCAAHVLAGLLRLLPGRCYGYCSDPTVAGFWIDTTRSVPDISGCGLFTRGCRAACHYAGTHLTVPCVPHALPTIPTPRSGSTFRTTFCTYCLSVRREKKRKRKRRTPHRLRYAVTSTRPSFATTPRSPSPGLCHCDALIARCATYHHAAGRYTPRRDPLLHAHRLHVGLVLATPVYAGYLLHLSHSLSISTDGDTYLLRSSRTPVTRSQFYWTPTRYHYYHLRFAVYAGHFTRSFGRCLPLVLHHPHRVLHSVWTLRTTRCVTLPFHTHYYTARSRTPLCAPLTALRRTAGACPHAPHSPHSPTTRFGCVASRHRCRLRRLPPCHLLPHAPTFALPFCGTFAHCGFT